MGILFTPNNGTRRLSKPRTNTSSITLNSSDPEVDIVSPPKPSGQQDYFGDHAAVVSSQGERRSPRKSRSRIRAYLHGSNTETTHIPSDDEDGQSALVGAARDVRKRLSRTGSSIMQLQSAKPSTVRLSDSSSSRLQLSGSQSSDAEDSALVADQIKEKAHHDRIAAQNHVTSPVDEDKHVDSVLAPVRRKSLYTPGLATRNPSDILKKPPQAVNNEPGIDRDYYYDPSKPKESPLSQLAALHLIEDGRATPSNINYPQLGGLQLGTLRVTNGIASPVPRNRTSDVVRRSSTPESKTRDDHSTVSEGRMIGEHTLFIPPRGSSPLGLERRAESPLPLDSQANMRPYEAIHSQYSDSALSIAHEYISELEGSPFSQKSPLRPEVEDAMVDDETVLISQAESSAAHNWRSFIDGAEVRHRYHETQEDALRKLNGDTSSTVAPDHLQRPSIPYSTSSHDFGHVEVPQVDSGYVSTASLSASQTVAQCNGMDPMSSIMSQEADQTMARANSIGLKSPAMTGVPTIPSISGPREIPLSVLERGRYSLQEAGPPPLPYSFSVMPRSGLQIKEWSSTRPLSQNAVRKLRKRRPKSQPPSPVVFGQGCCELVQNHIPRVPSIIAVKHAERLRQFPLLDHTFPSSQHTNVISPDSLSGPDTGVYPLPIRFPSPANALEAAVSGELSESSKLDEEEKFRSRAFWKSRNGPAVTDRKSNSRSRAPSKHRYSTIMQEQDGEWPDSGIVRSPSWSDFGRGRRRKEQKRLTKQEQVNEKRLVKEEKELEKRLEKDRKNFEKQSKKNDGRRRFVRSRSASRTRAKSSDRSSQNEALAIADFGTVTESLGGSPYDIATSLISRASYDAGNCHPHQISTAMPMLKSVVGADEVAAAEAIHARTRPRGQSLGRPATPGDEILVTNHNDGRNIRPQTMFVDVPAMPAVAAVDLRAYGFTLADNQQRSQSVAGSNGGSGGSLKDRDVLLERPTPYFLCMDAPPMPALPTAQQVAQREAQLERSRPHSMIIVDASLSGSQSSHRGEVVQSNSPVSSVEKSTKPRKPRAKTTVPDLWSKGSIERREPKNEKAATLEASDDPIASDENPLAKQDNTWEAQCQAWRQRRQSAGEVLLKNRTTNKTDDRLAFLDSPPQQEPQHGSPVPKRHSTVHFLNHSRPAQTLELDSSFPNSLPNPLASHPYTTPQEPSKTAAYQSASTQHHPHVDLQIMTRATLRPGPSPLASRPAAPSQHSPAEPRASPHHASTYTIPRKSIGSGSITPTGSGIDHLSGRYDGGLLYGYEPGFGLGGSAGTRGAKTGASRKSIEVSRGFGLDLSDVPIFLAPTMDAR